MGLFRLGYLRKDSEYRLKTPVHILIIDCLDCGRQIAYKSACGGCGGHSWLPAGYFNRMALQQLNREYRDGYKGT